MGSWVSSLATTVNTQPSGEVTTPGGADATTPLSGGGPGSSAGGCADARDADPIGISEQAATTAMRFNMFNFPVRVRLGLNGLGDAEVRDDVIGVVGGRRQRRVRADERLARALVGLDPHTGDRDARR